MKLNIFITFILLCFISKSIQDTSGNGYGPENVTQHSGYITINQTTSKLFRHNNHLLITH